jgi:hypothetical protein
VRGWGVTLLRSTLVMHVSGLRHKVAALSATTTAGTANERDRTLAHRAHRRPVPP